MVRFCTTSLYEALGNMQAKHQKGSLGISIIILQKKNTIFEAYPSFHAKGSYKVIKEIENLIVLKVYNINGDGNTEPHFLNIGVDKRRQQLTIHDRVYKKIATA